MSEAPSSRRRFCTPDCATRRPSFGADLALPSDGSLPLASVVGVLDEHGRCAPLQEEVDQQDGQQHEDGAGHDQRREPGREPVQEREDRHQEEEGRRQPPQSVAGHRLVGLDVRPLLSRSDSCWMFTRLCSVRIRSSVSRRLDIERSGIDSSTWRRCCASAAWRSRSKRSETTMRSDRRRSAWRAPSSMFGSRSGPARRGGGRREPGRGRRDRAPASRARSHRCAAQFLPSPRLRPRS